VLRQLFEATGGTVVDVSIPRDRSSGKPRGFGFVTMSSSEQAETAREALDGSVQAGRSISVRPFQAEPPRRSEAPRAAPAPSQDRTLYVGNLPYECTEQEVEALMKGAGVEGIARINLPVGADGRRRGFGFVNMESGEAAVDALDKLQGAEMGGRKLIINIAHPKGERPPRDRFDAPSRGPSSAPGGGHNHSGPPPDPGEMAMMMPPPPPNDVPRRSHDERKRTRPENDRAQRAGRPRRKERRRSGRRRGGFADDYDDE
ncbi:MAG: RNA recognition motif domain-containing protein, partial [Myxococcota bacterium]